MRLSHGFVRGEALSCIYHGWRYGNDGQCLAIPAHPDLEPPKTIRVETYPVVEQDGVIWIGRRGATGSPPRLEGKSPVRTISIQATIEAIEAAAGVKANAEGLLHMTALNALIGHCENGETVVHVLVEADADGASRIAASRAAEALRRNAETGLMKGAA